MPMTFGLFVICDLVPCVALLLAFAAPDTGFDLRLGFLGGMAIMVAKGTWGADKDL